MTGNYNDSLLYIRYVCGGYIESMHICLKYCLIFLALQFLFKETVRVVYKGGNPRNDPSNLGYSIEQANLVQQIISNKDNSYEVLLIGRNSGKDDILRAYKKLAILLHPDKNAAPGSGEAFKILNNAKDELLGKI